MTPFFSKKPNPSICPQEQLGFSVCLKGVYVSPELSGFVEQIGAMRPLKDNTAETPQKDNTSYFSSQALWLVELRSHSLSFVSLQISVAQPCSREHRPSAF